MGEPQRFSYAQRPDLGKQLEQEETGAFPSFLLHDDVWNECWPHLIGEFASFQHVLYDPEEGILLGGQNAVPLRWDGTVEDLPAGTHAVLRRSIDENLRGIRPNTVCGVQAIATDAGRGRGLSEAFVRFSRERALERGMEHSIIPLRLLLKDRYPISPVAEYVNWRRADGTIFDPWLRVWLRAGAGILEICEDSLLIRGTVAQWEQWTSMEFPASGRYVIPGGQEPLVIDQTADRGRYSETHVWIETPLSSP